MKLIERHMLHSNNCFFYEAYTVKRSNPFYEDVDKLCLQSKNVFNSTLYVIKQAFIKKEKIPSYVDLDRLWRQGNADYKSLP